MPVVTRYFDVSAAGLGDGTSWANRAALATAGNWSTVITLFNFSGSDSLKCLIGPGTYTISQQLQSTLFLNPPTTANPLFLHGCDSSGVQLAPSNPGWVSAQPVDWDSTLPVLSSTGNVVIYNLSNAYYRLLKMTGSGNTTNPLMLQVSGGQWLVIENTANNTSTTAVASNAASRIVNSCYRCTGTAYNNVCSINNTPRGFANVRIEGNASASSGNRQGINTNNANNRTLIGFTVVNNPGGGIVLGNSGNVFIDSCVIANNGSTGILGSTTGVMEVTRCMVTGNGGYGIDTNAAGATVAFIGSNRLRANTSGNFNGFGNYPTDLDNDVSAGTDAAEYVDATNGDFRIKNTSSLWGKGYGAGDQVSSGGGVIVVEED